MVCKLYPDTAVGGRGKTGGEKEGGGGTSNSKKEDNHNWGGKKQKWSTWVLNIGILTMVAVALEYLFNIVRCLERTVIIAVRVNSVEQ